MNRGADAVFGRAMKTYSKAGRIHKVPAAAYWPLDVNRQQLFDSSGGSAMAANSSSTNPQPMEETSRKKSTVGSRRKRTAKKAIVSLKENCEPSEEPASKRGKTNSVGNRRVRATKRQALENLEREPSDSIPQNNKSESVVLPRPAKFVTTRRGAARPIASIPLQNLDSSDEFVLGKAVSKGQKSQGCKARVTFSPESSVNNTVQSDGRSAIRRVGQQSSISEAEDQTFDTFQTRKPLFCSTPALQLAGKRPGIAAAPPISPLDLSAAEDLVSPGDPFSPPLSVPLKEPGSGSKTVPITTEAPDRHGISSVLLFSDVSDAVSSYRSVYREAKMLTDALKDECLSRRWQVQLERVDKLLLQTPYGSCLGYSSSYLCPQIIEEPQLVATSVQTVNQSDQLCPRSPCHVTDYSASLIDGQIVHPLELVTDKFNLSQSGKSSHDHTSSLALSVEPSVTDIHTSSLAHSEPSVTASDIHSSSLANSEPSVTASDIHSSSLAHSEPSVTASDIHSSSLANSVLPSVTDNHTGSLAHSVECSVSVASAQSANQVDDNIDGVTDAWLVKDGSCVVLDQQQFHKEVLEDKAAMIIAKLKEECLTKTSTVPLKRLVLTQWTGAHGGHGMHCDRHSVEPSESVTDVHTGSLAHSVEHSGTDIHTSICANLVEPSVTVSDIHTSICVNSGEPSVTVSDIHTNICANSVEPSVTVSDIHTSICANSVEPSVTVSDIHTSICANSVEPSVTVSDTHSSSLENSFVPSVTDIHTGSLAHSVECSMSVASAQSANQVDDNIDGATDACHKEVPEEEAEVIIARLKDECLTKTSTVPLERLVLTQWTGANGHGMHPDRHSVEPSESVIDVHIGSLAHLLEPSVTDIHTCNLAHSVECNQSVASVQPAHQVNDTIESVTDPWPVESGSCIVVDQQQFNEDLPEDKAVMIIARLKEECLTKTSTVSLKRLVLPHCTGAHSMHSEDTASEKVTCSEDVSADAKECVQNPNERRTKKISRATKETKRRSGSRDRPGTARKAFVSGLSVSRWRDGGSAKADRFKRGRSNAGDGSIIGYNASKVFNDGLLHGTGICSTPVRALPGNLDLSSLLADLKTPETHTWSRLKARLSVHRRFTVRMTPRRLQSSVLESSARAGLFDRSMDLFDMSGRTPFSKRLQSRLQNSVLPHQSISEGLEDDLTDAEKVYAECNQQGPLCWEECIVPERLKRCKKIGEGTFGEVFSTVNASGDTVALKVIPIEGKEKVNGEEQKTFGDILHEMIISKELSGLKEKPQNQTYGFIGLHGLHCVKGSYPAVMLKAWDAFDHQKVSENDRPDFFENDQLFLVLEFEFGGSDLENSNGKLSSLAVAKSILHQVAAALAVAERQLCFEHRDLHWGNILVRATKEKSTSFLLDGIKHSLNTNGVLVRIIDYSLSRMEIDGLTVACDISEDEELFMGHGDYQFDIYRLMREENSNKWDDYQPHSNVLWLHYLCDKLLSMQYRSKGGSRAKDIRKELKHIHDNLLQCRSANEALQSGLF